MPCLYRPEMSLTLLFLGCAGVVHKTWMPLLARSCEMGRFMSLHDRETQHLFPFLLMPFTRLDRSQNSGVGLPFQHRVMKSPASLVLNEKEDGMQIISVARQLGFESLDTD